MGKPLYTVPLSATFDSKLTIDGETHTYDDLTVTQGGVEVINGGKLIVKGKAIIHGDVTLKNKANIFVGELMKVTGVLSVYENSDCKCDNVTVSQKLILGDGCMFHLENFNIPIIEQAPLQVHHQVQIIPMIFPVLGDLYGAGYE